MLTLLAIAMAVLIVLARISAVLQCERFCFSNNVCSAGAQAAAWGETDDGYHCSFAIWYRSLDRSQWNTLSASNLGWLFDGYETYALVISVGVALRRPRRSASMWDRGSR
jgi:hypothetical protein